jgi:hypothetical protein
MYDGGGTTKVVTTIFLPEQVANGAILLKVRGKGRD